jgi:DNA-binding CsgD family transcriptional regulator
MTSLSTSSVEILVKLLSTATDPSVERPLADRQRSLMEGLKTLIRADAWLSASGPLNPNVRGDGIAVTLIDGGWSDEHQRAEALGVISHPQLQPIAAPLIHESLDERRCMTYSRDQLMSDAQWWISPAGKAWRASGFDEFLISVTPLQENQLSWISYHRRLGKPSFGAVERTILHTVVSQAAWIRGSSRAAVAPADVVHLSPRERQVLLLLLGGDSRKEVAMKLKLSQHTVSDYLKEIYRKLGVVTRAELLSKFIGGGTLMTALQEWPRSSVPAVHASTSALL